MTGDGFTFRAPAGWGVSAKSGLVSTSHGPVDLVEVATFELVHAYTHARLVAASRELDGVAASLAKRLGGKVEARRTLTAGGLDARGYSIRYGDKTQELTFALDGGSEYELVCRRLTGADDSACAELVSTFRLTAT